MTMQETLDALPESAALDAAVEALVTRILAGEDESDVGPAANRAWDAFRRTAIAVSTQFACDAACARGDWRTGIRTYHAYDVEGCRYIWAKLDAVDTRIVSARVLRKMREEGVRLESGGTRRAWAQDTQAERDFWERVYCTAVARGHRNAAEIAEEACEKWRVAWTAGRNDNEYYTDLNGGAHG